LLSAKEEENFSLWMIALNRTTEEEAREVSKESFMIIWRDDGTHCASGLLFKFSSL
jgi:hypothetical protein